jgi:hypothetical protein
MTADAPALFQEGLYLPGMYRSGYYPDFLVDKVKALLKEGVALLESGERDPGVIQGKFDEIMAGINSLQHDFWDNGSELETGARESIGQTVTAIIEHFGLPTDAETLMQDRDW